MGYRSIGVHTYASVPVKDPRPASLLDLGDDPAQRSRTKARKANARDLDHLIIGSDPSMRTKPGDYAEPALSALQSNGDPEFFGSLSGVQSRRWRHV